MTEQFDPTTHPHRRYNPLTNTHILVSPHRTKRPWLGQTEPLVPSNLSQHDKNCYLCPGNTRANGSVNEDYKATLVFENDYAAVLPLPGPASPVAPHPLLTAEPVQGGCDVVCFHPRHDLSLPTLSVDDIVKIIKEWTRIFHHRSTQDGIKYIQIFENKGAMMGCSNPHPHSQVWSISVLPTLPAKELSNLRDYAQSSTATTNGPKGYQNKPCLFCEYVTYERTAKERVVVENEHFVALVPWWAYWPFEVMVLPYRRHIPSLSHFAPEEIHAFAEIISQVTIRYDNLFSCSFAYAMGVHQRPLPPKRVDGMLVEDEDDVAHFHVHFEPPLLRSATVRKFMAGYEVMAEPQRDLTQEQAAQRLIRHKQHLLLITAGAVYMMLVDLDVLLGGRRCRRAGRARKQEIFYPSGCLALPA